MRYILVERRDLSGGKKADEERRKEAGREENRGGSRVEECRRKIREGNTRRD